jgi:predicted RNase H-like nuclease (RuvC/YqgF family)
VRELCGRKFSTDEKKRWSIEKKSDFAKRLKHSPDYGDAACLNAFLALKHGLSGIEPSRAAVEMVKREERAAAAPRYSGHSQRSLYGGR